MKLAVVLFLFVWAGLAVWCYGEILPPTLVKAKTPHHRALAYGLCFLLSILVAVLAPIRWMFPDKDEEE